MLPLLHLNTGVIHDGSNTVEKSEKNGEEYAKHQGEKGHA